MPYYNFKCSNEKCGDTYDDLVKMGTSEVDCRTCGNKAYKTIESYKFAALGLPNGHNAVRVTKNPKKLD